MALFQTIIGALGEVGRFLASLWGVAKELLLLYLVDRNRGLKEKNRQLRKAVSRYKVLKDARDHVDNAPRRSWSGVLNAARERLRDKE